MADVINICVHFFENHMYICPEERHMFVKVIAFCLYLIDGYEANVAKLDQKKRISISKLDKIFKVFFLFFNNFDKKKFSQLMLFRYLEICKFNHFRLLNVPVFMIHRNGFFLILKVCFIIFTF